MEKYTMFMHQKNHYSENVFTNHRNLWIQCNLYQATNGIFQRPIKHNFPICMEIKKKKTSDSQSNLEKEEWNWRNQPA